MVLTSPMYRQISPIPEECKFTCLLAPRLLLCIYSSLTLVAFAHLNAAEIDKWPTPPVALSFSLQCPSEALEP